VKDVVSQVDSMQPDREDGGKGWVLISDSVPLLIWGVGVLLLSYATPGDVAPAQMVSSQQDAPWQARRR